MDRPGFVVFAETLIVLTNTLQIGADSLVRHMSGFADLYGSQFVPSELLVQKGKSGAKFHQ